MAPRQFGNNCHALLTNIKRTVCFPLLSRAVPFTAASPALYGTMTAGRGTVINGRWLEASHWTLVITTCCTELKDQFRLFFCTQYSFGGQWWMYPEAVWFCFKISLDEESKNIPCRLAINWQSYLLWHVNIEAQPKWNVTPHAAWVLIIDIFMKLLWKAWEIKT